jgi:hypothetical protein
MQKSVGAGMLVARRIGGLVMENNRLGQSRVLKIRAVVYYLVLSCPLLSYPILSRSISSSTIL